MLLPLTLEHDFGFFAVTKMADGFCTAALIERRSA
jgi:hypothetical protein